MLKRRSRSSSLRPSQVMRTLRSSSFGSRARRRWTIGSSAAAVAAFVSRRVGSATAAAFTMHRSFSELIPLYDAFILDQFGVMHNGRESLPGAVRCVAELKRRGKRFVILSNTSAPSHFALARLSRYGFHPEDFVGAVTSGEEASKYIRSMYGSSSLSQPDGKSARALMITWDSRDINNPRLTSRPEDFLLECGEHVQVVPTVEEAEFLLLHGSEVWYRSQDDQVPLSFIDTGTFKDELNRLLSSCARLRLPMVCANADFVVRNPDGGTAHMPGKIAQRYRELGGHGVVFGKPQVDHFLACLDRLGCNDPSNIAHVGDSLHHDVGGARAAGVPSIFVTSGIHADEHDWEYGRLPPRHQLEALFDREGIIPTHVVPSLAL